MRRALLALAVVLTGCNIDLPDAWEVERPRIVAMRVEIDGDAARAAPLGEETVALTPIVVSPEAEDDTLSTAWLACLAAPTRTGVPSCGDAPLAISGLPMANVVQPIGFTLPAIAPSPLGAPSVLVTIASCDSGAVPDLSGLGMGSTMLPTCMGGADGARAELTVFSMPLATDLETANRHPRWADETITIAIGDGDAVTWPASDPFPTGPCGALTPTEALPRVVTADPPPVVTFGWTSSDDDREAYTAPIEGEGGTLPRRETLQFSHLASVGAFERAFSSVDEEDDDGAMRDIEWTPPVPMDVPADGIVVRFWWVVRDLRGGTDVATRALCLVPG